MQTVKGHNEDVMLVDMSIRVCDVRRAKVGVCGTLVASRFFETQRPPDPAKHIALDTICAAPTENLV